MDYDLFSVLIHAGYSAYTSVFHQQMLRRSLQQKLCPMFLGILRHDLYHGSCTARSGFAVLRHHDVPGCLGSGEITCCFVELNTHIFQPPDRLGRLAEILFDQVCVHSPVGVVHEHPERVFHADGIQISLLDIRVDTERAHSAIGGSACLLAFFYADDFQPHLRRLCACSSSSGAARHHREIAVHLSHHLFLLS